MTGLDEPMATPAASHRTRVLVISALLAFIVGVTLTAYVLTRPGRLVTAPAPVGTPAVKLAAPAPAPTPPPPAMPPRPVADPAALAALDVRITDLEGRIDRVSERARAASGNAARAEGLLVAFAARRALDRGMGLGYIEAQLRDRFGTSQPAAVATVIAASRDPVTLEELRLGLDDLAPALVSGSDGGWWQAVRRELGSLAVVRKAGTPSPEPTERARRARRMLEGGRVDAALAEVARMPGRDKAGNWIALARRYIAARQALDMIETSAILQPEPTAAQPAQ
ncbi:hypothetical protein [Sphingomonas flavalba]|uniref:hypothetical protein n=1 Tax=Sphingomonas flavalba TaxID=2559804 RepID=UPI00109E0F31|nr:hypothetical protein [Sphingomonas flavalba]